MYAILGAISSTTANCLSSFKSSKQAWDYLKRKYDNDFYSGIRERSSSFEVDMLGCSALMASHIGEVSTKSTHWADVKSDEVYSLQETYDQLVYEHLKLKKSMEKIDHSQ